MQVEHRGACGKRPSSGRATSRTHLVSGWIESWLRSRTMQLPRLLYVNRRRGIFGIAGRRALLHPFHDRLDFLQLDAVVTGNQCPIPLRKPRRHPVREHDILHGLCPRPRLLISQERHGRHLSGPMAALAMRLKDREDIPVIGHGGRDGRRRRQRHPQGQADHPRRFHKHLALPAALESCDRSSRRSAVDRLQPRPATAKTAPRAMQGLILLKNQRSASLIFRVSGIVKTVRRRKGVYRGASSCAGPKP